MDMFGENTDGHKYGTLYYTLKRIDIGSTEDSQLLLKVLKGSRFDDED